MDFVKSFSRTEMVLGLGIIFTPLIPSNLLAVLDIIFIRIFVIFALLWAITKGPRIGLLTFIFIAVLYLERNRRKMDYARDRFIKIVEADTPPQMSVEEEGQGQTTVNVRDFDKPEDRTFYYLPNPSCAANSNTFTPPDGTLNGKIVFPSVPQGEKAAKVFQRDGFGRIPGLPTA
jgi:hypothetical protein